MPLDGYQPGLANHTMAPVCPSNKSKAVAKRNEAGAKTGRGQMDARMLLATVPTPLRRISGKRSFEALAQPQSSSSDIEEMARKKGAAVATKTAKTMTVQAAIKKTWKLHASFRDLFEKKPGRRAPAWDDACEAAAEQAVKDYDELWDLFKVLSEGGALQWEDTETPAGCSYKFAEIHGAAVEVTKGRASRVPIALQAREALLGVCSMLAAHKHMSWLEAYDGEEPNRGYFAHALFSGKHYVRLAGLSTAGPAAGGAAAAPAPVEVLPAAAKLLASLPSSSLSSLSSASTSAASSPTTLPSATPSPSPSPTLAPLPMPLPVPLVSAMEGPGAPATAAAAATATAATTTAATTPALTDASTMTMAELALTASESDSETPPKLISATAPAATAKATTTTTTTTTASAAAPSPKSFQCSLRPACLMVNASLPLWKALEGTDSGGPLKELPESFRTECEESRGLQLALQELDYTEDLGKWGSLPEERAFLGSLVPEPALNELLWSKDREVLVIKVYASLLPRGVQGAPSELPQVVREELLNCLKEAKAAGQAVVLQLGGDNPHLLACKVYLTSAFTSLGLRCGYLRWRADASQRWAREQSLKDRVCLGLLLP